MNSELLEASPAAHARAPPTMRRPSPPYRAQRARGSVVFCSRARAGVLLTTWPSKSSPAAGACCSQVTGFDYARALRPSGLSCGRITAAPKSTQVDGSAFGGLTERVIAKHVVLPPAGSLPCRPIAAAALCAAPLGPVQAFVRCAVCLFCCNTTLLPFFLLLRAHESRALGCCRHSPPAAATAAHHRASHPPPFSITIIVILLAYTSYTTHPSVHAYATYILPTRPRAR